MQRGVGWCEADTGIFELTFEFLLRTNSGWCFSKSRRAFPLQNQ